MQLTDVRFLRHLLVSPHPGMSDRLLAIIRETGTLLEGHFELDPKRHTPYFIRFSEIGWRPHLADEVAGMLLEAAPFAAAPATIVCAETSAIFLAQALGRKTGNPVAVTALDMARHPTAKLRTGHLDDAHPILIVSDVITTGRSLIPLLRLKSSVEHIRGIVAFAVLSTARFQELARSHQVEAEWLLSSTWESNRPHPSECNGCANGTPVLHAGEFS